MNHFKMLDFLGGESRMPEPGRYLVKSVTGEVVKNKNKDSCSARFVLSLSSLDDEGNEVNPDNPATYQMYVGGNTESFRVASSYGVPFIDAEGTTDNTTAVGGWLVIKPGVSGLYSNSRFGAFMIGLAGAAQAAELDLRQHDEDATYEGGSCFNVELTLLGADVTLVQHTIKAKKADRQDETMLVVSEFHGYKDGDGEAETEAAEEAITPNLKLKAKDSVADWVKRLRANGLDNKAVVAETKRMVATVFANSTTKSSYTPHFLEFNKLNTEAAVKGIK